MELTTILLISALVLEGALGAGLYLVWRQARQASRGDGTEESVRRELGRLERYLDGKVDLILAELRERPDRNAEYRTARTNVIGRVAPPPEPETAVWPEPVTPPEIRPRPPRRGRELSDAEQLDLLLDSPDFKTGIWPRMDGPFHVAEAHLLGFLTAQGGTEPEIEAHPPFGTGYENHWDFMVLSSNDGDEGAVRFLIPRNYSRYDPAMHDHLFKVMGNGESLESFIRELRRCAVLRGSGPLEEFIRPELVTRKGVLVV